MDDIGVPICIAYTSFAVLFETVTQWEKRNERLE